MVHPKPEDSRKAIREPTGEQGADESQQIVEDGDGLGNDHGDGPGCKSDTEPGKIGEFCSSNHVLGVAEKSGEDVGRGDMAVNDTGNHNS